MRFSARRNIRAIAIVAIAVLITPVGLAQQPEQPDMTIDAKMRSEVVAGLILHLNTGYVFPDVAKKMGETLSRSLQEKRYDSVTSAAEFARLLTEHLQEVSKDKHLRVGYSHSPIPLPTDRGEPTPQEIEDFRKALAWRNFGFERVERLPGNVWYIDLRGFTPAVLSAETIVAAMNLVSNADAVIFDLRKNGGGDPATVALISSYLFDDPVHLNDLYFRPRDETRQWWTLPFVPGKKLGSKTPVYVLTSKRTFSAAEEFTYNLKNLKRATIVGETTGGGAHPGGRRRINAHFAVFVPSGRAINPISKTNWEGTGVVPDIAVSADDALRVAQLDVLEKLLKSTEEPPRKREITEAIEKLKER